MQCRVPPGVKNFQSGCRVDKCFFCVFNSFICNDRFGEAVAKVHFMGAVFKSVITKVMNF